MEWRGRSGRREAGHRSSASARCGRTTRLPRRGHAMGWPEAVCAGVHALAGGRRRRRVWMSPPCHGRPGGAVKLVLVEKRPCRQPCGARSRRGSRGGGRASRLARNPRPEAVMPGRFAEPRREAPRPRTGWARPRRGRPWEPRRPRARPSRGAATSCWPPAAARGRLSRTGVQLGSIGATAAQGCQGRGRGREPRGRGRNAR